MSEYSTIEEISEHFRVSISTIRKWVASGFIPKDTYVHVDKVLRFNLPAVETAVLGKTARGKEKLTPGATVDPRHFYKPKGNN